MLAVIQFIIFPSLSENQKIKIFEIIISSFILYGFETWFLTLREECSVRVVEKKNADEGSWT
jgi:hypothetical protein